MASEIRLSWLEYSLELFLHQKLIILNNTFLSEKLSDKKPWSTGLERKNEKKKTREKNILLNLHIADKHHEQSGMSFAVICNYIQACKIKS